jgi:hypothetical protein
MFARWTDRPSSRSPKPTSASCEGEGKDWFALKSTPIGENMLALILGCNIISGWRAFSPRRIAPGYVKAILLGHGKKSMLFHLEHVDRETIGANLAIPVGPKAIHLIVLDTSNGH